MVTPKTMDSRRRVDCLLPPARWVATFRQAGGVLWAWRARESVNDPGGARCGACPSPLSPPPGCSPRWRWVPQASVQALHRRCASPPRASHARTGRARAGGDPESEIYAQVLRRYLSTPAENSFPGQAFKTVYVLGQAGRDAADPDGKHEHGTPITAPTQHQLIADLAGMARVVFITSRYSDRGPERLRAGQERRHPDHPRVPSRRRPPGAGRRQRLGRLRRRHLAHLRPAQPARQRPRAGHAREPDYRGRHQTNLLCMACRRPRCRPVARLKLVPLCRTPGQDE
jgi:hypothetical protein